MDAHCADGSRDRAILSLGSAGVAVLLEVETLMLTEALPSSTLAGPTAG